MSISAAQQNFEPNLFHGHLGFVVAVAPAPLLLAVGHFLAVRAEGTSPPFGSESLARLTAAGASCLPRGCGGGTWCRIGRGGGKMNVAFKGQAKASSSSSCSSLVSWRVAARTRIDQTPLCSRRRYTSLSSSCPSLAFSTRDDRSDVDGKFYTLRLKMLT